MVEYVEEKESISPTLQMGVVVIVVTIAFLFMGLSSQKVLSHNIYYLLMFFGCIVAAYIIYKDEIGEKLHFTTKNLPLVNVVIYGITIGLLLVFIESFSMPNSMLIEQSMEPTQSMMATAAGAVAMAMAYALVTSISEETMARGVLASIADNFSEGNLKAVGKYFVIPLIFALLHYFMWSSSGMLNLGSFTVVFLILYHFTFALICQIALDLTGSIYTPIAIHMVYNGCKELMALGIITWGNSIFQIVMNAIAGFMGVPAW
jgi:membrane protease YdiL (CAAX protease family)